MTITKPAPQAKASEPIAWEVHPAAGQPIKAAVSIMAVGMIVGGVYQFSGGVLLSAISFFILVISLSPFFQKTRFEITDEGVSRHILFFSRFLSWKQIKRCCINRKGMYISAFSRDSWKDIKGIYLLFEGHKEELIAKVKEQLQKNQIQLVSRVQR